MSDTEDKVALSDSETNMAGGDTEEKKESESSGKYGGQRRDNRRRRRVNSDEPIGPVVPIVLGSEVTKWGIRKKVWDSIEEHNLANFPRPVHHRIPNFKGAPAAAEKVLTMDVFKKANVVKVNPDKPQEQARFLTLEANKTLLVPTPRLRNGLFNKINPPGDCGKEILRICSTSQGVREYSSPVSLEDKVKIDLIITGSVAVSKEDCKSW